MKIGPPPPDLHPNPLRQNTQKYKSTLLEITTQKYNFHPPNSQDFHFSPTCLKMYPTRLRLLHSGLAIRFIIVHPFIVPKRRASNNVSNYKDDQYNDVYNRDLSPALLDAGQHSCLARVACIAELALVVAPPGTVIVVPHDPPSRVPHRLIHVGVAALCRGLATPWL